MLGWFALQADAATAPKQVAPAEPTRHTFCREMPKTIRPDHPAIRGVVDAIRAISQDPREQLIIVHDVTHLLVDYDSDERVYGQVEYHATLEQMMARRRESGWIYLRDDCDGRAVFAAHLLSGLGIPWRLEASYWKRHAWISATVDGVRYDLLDLGKDDPELQTLAYKTLGHFFTRKTRLPPYFHWRRAWLQRTHGDVEIGLRLGMLEVGSHAGNLRERFSTDWLKRHPQGNTSPADPMVAMAPFAGFPFKESLNPTQLVEAERGPGRADAESARVTLSQSPN